MVLLCSTQQQQLNRCLSEIFRFEGQFPTLLLTGRPGAGKRTCARAIADALEIGYVEIPLMEPSEILRSRLFGSEFESILSQENQNPPGELASLSNVVVYLSGLHNLPEDIHHEFQRLVTRRIYRDKTGKEWQLPSDIIILAGLTDSMSGVVTQEHWLRYQFHSEISIVVPRNENEILEVLKNIVLSIDPACHVSISENEAVDLMKAAQWNLRTLRDWLQRAIIEKKSLLALDIRQIWRVLEEDVEYILSRIEYCATTVSLENYRAWATQFPKDLRGLPLYILKQISSTYYISGYEFQRGIQSLVKFSGIKSQNKVVFCKWQALGLSAPIVTNELKNRGQWALVDELDLDSNRNTWPNLGDERYVNFVLADDFVGSGRTLNKLLNSKACLLRDLLKLYPTSQLTILIIVAYENAIRQARMLARKISNRISIHVYKLYDSKDQCFTENSRIFNLPEERVRIQEFFREVARNYFPPFLQRHPFGYAGIASLCIFHNTVPNNSLPVLWFDNDKYRWKPLFPARGLELTIMD